MDAFNAGDLLGSGARLEEGIILEGRGAVFIATFGSRGLKGAAAGLTELDNGLRAVEDARERALGPAEPILEGPLATSKSSSTSKHFPEKKSDGGIGWSIQISLPAKLRMSPDRTFCAPFRAYTILIGIMSKVGWWTATWTALRTSVDQDFEARPSLH